MFLSYSEMLPHSTVTKLGLEKTMTCHLEGFILQCKSHITSTLGSIMLVYHLQFDVKEGFYNK